MKNKMQMQTPSLADRNFATLFALFPNAVTETITGYEDILDENGEPIKDTDGNVKQRAIIERTVDPDVLQQEINTHVLQENLKKICNEIFGESNCVGIGQLRRVEGKPGKSKDMGRTSEFVIIYAKEKDRFTIGTLPVSEAGLKEFRYEDEKGRFRRGQIYYPNRGIHNYTVNTPYGNSITGDFTVQKEVFDNYNSENKIYWAEQGEHTPYLKIYLSEYEGTTPTNTFGKEFGSSQGAVKALFEMNEMLFDNPKPTKFLNKLLLIGNVSNNDIILDFFSGSATTAHAVMQLNAHEAEAAHRSGNRKFILVQIPELCKEDSEAFKAGYKNICEIGKERIRRAGAKIKEQNLLITTELDIGFRVLKLDTSNMEDVYYTPDKIAQMILQGETEKLLENIKKDRTAEDLLFQVMLDLGVELSAKIEVKQIDGVDVHFAQYGDGKLIACFEQVNDNIIEFIAKEKPYFAVFRDSSFADDSAFLNAEQKFQTYSPDTVRRVL